jgi:DNA repair exonuclease SbcCD ATPase subunit
MNKPKRSRTARREMERKVERLAKDRERLFGHEPGGSAERPIEVDSAAVVEVRARSVPCPTCGGEHDVNEHAAVTTRGDRLREVKLRCRRCGASRSLWFRLPVLN